MSYLKIPVVAINGQTSIVLPKSKIVRVVSGNAAGANLTTVTTIFMDTGVATLDAYQFSHTAAAQAGAPVGSTQSYNVADIIQDAWTANPGSIVSVVGGIPATQSATNQALTFVQFTALAVA
jgi:hypothetical protein